MKNPSPKNCSKLKKYKIDYQHVIILEPLKKLPESPKSKKLSSPKQPIETEKYNSPNGTSHAYPVQSKPGILNKKSPKSKGFPSEKASFRIRRKSVAHAHSSNKAGNIFEKIMSKIHKHM